MCAHHAGVISRLIEKPTAETPSRKPHTENIQLTDWPGSHCSSHSLLSHKQSPAKTGRRTPEIETKVTLTDPDNHVSNPAIIVDDADIPEESDSCVPGWCSKSGTCFVVIYLWLAVLIVICLTALVVVIVFIVRPYLHAQMFQATECRALVTVYSEYEKDCSCGKGCSSSFPCVEIIVSLLDEKLQVHRSFLREHETALATKVSDRFWLHFVSL